MLYDYHNLELVKSCLPEDRFSANKRWDEGVPHHPDAKLLMKFLRQYDSEEMGGYLDLEVGGDGDSGENLLYALSVFFEFQDHERRYDRDE